MSANLTFVLVPGNFLPPSYYDATAKLLESRGFSTRQATIPSTGSPFPLTSNEPDVVAIRNILQELADSGTNVIIVAHSFGSIPSCEAAEGLEINQRRELGRSGGVVRLIFVAAWLLQEGGSAPEMIEKHKIESPWARFEDGNLFADDPTYAFHNDNAAVASQWNPSTTHSDLAVFATPQKYAAWRHIPTTYVLCEQDRCIPVHAQEAMVASAQGLVKLIRVPSGHVPMLSMRDHLVAILQDEASSA